MDSLTQFVLGAAVGEAVAGRKIGNKAMIWGAIGGTIPDLDVFFNFFYPLPQSLLMHRGFSHSIFFAMLAGPLLGWLLHKADRSLSRNDWMKLFFWSILTHPLLDIFTGYGTGLFMPLWNYRIQFDTIFIVDPIYTLPLLASFLWLLFKGRNFNTRIITAKRALVFSSAYLLLTVAVKLSMWHRVHQFSERQGIVAERMLVAPALFTPLLWSVIIEEGDHYWVGYSSLFDSEEKIALRKLPSNHQLLNGMAALEEIEMLSRFSKGYFVLVKEGDNFLWNDLRFGTTRGWLKEGGEFIFSFELSPGEEKLTVERVDPVNAVSPGDVSLLLQRATGN